MILRCPYCHRDLPSPPLASAVCPHCHKTMALPKKYLVPRNSEEKKRTLNRIARSADRERKGFRFQGTLGHHRVPKSILIVIIVGLVLIGSILVTSTRHHVERRAPRIRNAMDDLRTIAQALTLYRLHTGHYPTEFEGNLGALLIDPGTPGWQGPYITHLATDPFGRAYVYVPDGTNIPSLFSCGPDNIFGTEDDFQASSDDFEVPQDIIDTWKQDVYHPPSVKIAP